jgi:hypothetical protein
MEKATKVSLWKEEAKRDLQREDYNAKGGFQKHPPTHKKRLTKILYHSDIRIAGAAGASKDQSLRKELTLEADCSSSSTACWAGIGGEGDEGEATALTTAIEASFRL